MHDGTTITSLQELVDSHMAKWRMAMKSNEVPVQQGSVDDQPPVTEKWLVKDGGEV